MKKRILAGMVVALSVALFATTLAHALLIAPVADVTDPLIVPPEYPAGIETPPEELTATPVRLRIPALSLSAEVQHVGRTTAGNMGTPDNFSDVGWYKYGPVPGATGSAVMDGHVDNGLSLPGVFKDLKDVQIGDDVYVDADDDSILHFKVIDIVRYPYEAVPLAEVFGRTDAARLNLITCDGTWLPHKKTYDHRIVVYTKLVDH